MINKITHFHHLEFQGVRKCVLLFVGDFALIAKEGCTNLILDIPFQSLKPAKASTK